MNNLKLKIIDTPDFQILKISITGNGILEASILKNIELPKVNYAKGVILYGRAPIWIYGFFVHQFHPCRWIAIFDPRMGGIIIEAHHIEAPQLGYVIPIEVIQPHVESNQNLLQDTVQSTAQSKTSSPPSTLIIALVGPPHSGKSVFLMLLQESLKRILPISFYQEKTYTIRACPDGEGNWFHEAYPYSKTLRFKNQWNQSFVDNICQHIKEISKTKRLLFVDCGGKIDRFNHQILGLCNSALIVSRDDLLAAEWRGATQILGLNLLAQIQSVQENISTVISSSPILTVKLGKLERGINPEEVVLPEELIKKIQSLIS
ncbi:CRISPR-associated protein Csx3 [Candidatus Methylacidiphilum fumarolicum]|uniref:CRISPR-associated protein Csx3 n=2 Tax=Candidatus Methylacidiphilum fumarolicum TaxID=591154 RepID=I0JZ04_METFB|nr:CRISPR-associated ring nuclease Crn3/Csx3 [Candidatus Methylacidiphilum fumarolicum]MBW6414641.1 CRISPR-associated protein Csx3 [Candidatus Methylacidiphilum fumarolicum]TFE65661.1 CRISPR-associated protein Csx3 [Candidatus Methylacidiphilum fumarolicum]TFE74215.1 CRISPR-associated protein Csx3 [Candidatus Methylacidiphilum fumarolicum]TFE75714.1 CRISPR-associated protein Csx3 [Candidatus Methylacidiphilum fumarolicum]TFE75874.1 CRISPR-associated protein Csx3 [Candidatus Methylacidiphilum f